MKKYTLSLLLPLLLCLTGCKKDDDQHTNPVDQLPPATQTGAGTFAALVDGKPFIANNPWFNCFYQFVDGEYYFSIRGIDNNSMPKSISLGSTKKEIFEGEVYPLIEVFEGNVSGGGGFLFLQQIIKLHLLLLNTQVN